MKQHIISVRDIDRHDGAKYEGMGLAVTVKCPMSGAKNTVLCGRRDFQQWVAGTVIQEAFPYLSPDEREMLISGTDPQVWDRLYPDK